MTNQDQTDKKSASIDLLDFFALIYRSRYFLLIQSVLIAIISVLIALSVPKTFSASATILPPEQSGALTAFLPQGMTQGLNSVLGTSALNKGGETNKIMSILYSRNLAEKTIRKFDLIDRFDANTIEDAIESYREKVSVEVDEEGSIRVTVGLQTEFFHPEENETEVQLLAKEVSDYVVSELDNIYTSLETQRARYQLDVLDERYEKNLQDLRDIEENIKEFGEEFGVIALPEQTEAMIQNLAQLESQIAIEEVKLQVAKQTFQEGASEIRTKEILVSELNQKLNQLKNNGSASDSTGPLLAFTETPELALEYTRYRRDLTVQNLIYEFLTQQIEQLKLQEAKDTPSIQFVDMPQVPTKRSAPTRSLLTIGLFLSGMLISVLYVILKAYYYEKLSTFAEKVKHASEA